MSTRGPACARQEICKPRGRRARGICYIRRPMPAPRPSADTSMLARVGLGLSDWFEKWFPDAFALALAVVAIVFAASLLAGSTVLDTAQHFGAGFWDLVAFTMQMSMIVITGYAVATSPPIYALVRRLAGAPRTARGAVAFVALFSMLASLVSWSFSLIFSALLAREVAHRVKGSDYRSIGAAAYLGVGSIWALGLSSSAALSRSARRWDCGRVWRRLRFFSASRWRLRITPHLLRRRREAWRTWELN